MDDNTNVNHQNNTAPPENPLFDSTIPTSQQRSLTEAERQARLTPDDTERVFDDNGNLQQITMYKPEGYIKQEMLYDEKGSITRVIIYRDYNADVVDNRTYNKNNYIHKEIYFNSDGTIEREVFYNEDGIDYETRVY